MGPVENLGFVAPDTIVMTGLEGPSHWLTRFDVATGRLTDSVLMEAGGLLGQVMPSPDGSRLLAGQFESATSDSASVIVFDRRGRATATIRVAAVGSRSTLQSFVWSGSNTVIVGMSMEGVSGLVAVRYRLDGDGRVLPRADTLTMLSEGQIRLWWANADASVLYYDMARSGEISYWTATRDDIRGPFTRKRRVAASTAGLGAMISPRGGWIAVASSGGSLGTRLRIETESFDGGERHVLESSLDGLQNGVFSATDDSLILVTQGATGPLTIAAYGLPAGAAVPWPSFDRVGRIVDIAAVVDGRLAATLDSGRFIRVFARNGDVRDYRFPDSLGAAMIVRPSPTTAELVVSSLTDTVHLQFLVSRMNLLDGRVVPLTRSSTLQTPFAGGGGAVWSSDGQVRLELLNLLSAGNVAAAGAQPPALYRVSTTGGLSSRSRHRGWRPVRTWRGCRTMPAAPWCGSRARAATSGCSGRGRHGDALPTEPHDRALARSARRETRLDHRAIRCGSHSGSRGHGCSVPPSRQAFATRGCCADRPCSRTPH